MKLLEVEGGGHVPQCPIAGDTIGYTVDSGEERTQSDSPIFINRLLLYQTSLRD